MTEEQWNEANNISCTRNYILIDAKTRAPVPLPCYTDIGAVHAYHHEQGCYINQGERSYWVQPDEVGLALITEEQFMAEREGHFPLCSCPECCENG